MHIITAEKAIASNISSRELHSIAGWHEVRAAIGPMWESERHMRMAQSVRSVAFQVEDMTK